MRRMAWSFLLIVPLMWLLFLAMAQEPADWGDCKSCHEDKYPGAYRYMHPQETGCLSCHVTHDRKEEKLLLGDETILCQQPCHTDLGRSHPTGKNLRNPDSGLVQDLTCTNRCHDPHGSDFKNVLKMNARDLCFSCHDL